MIIARSGERYLDQVDATHSRVLIPSQDFIGPTMLTDAILKFGYWEEVDKPFDLKWPPPDRKSPYEYEEE